MYLHNLWSYIKKKVKGYSKIISRNWFLFKQRSSLNRSNQGRVWWGIVSERKQHMCEESQTIKMWPIWRTKGKITIWGNVGKTELANQHSFSNCKILGSIPWWSFSWNPGLGGLLTVSYPFTALHNKQIIGWPVAKQSIDISILKPVVSHDQNIATISVSILLKKIHNGKEMKQELHVIICSLPLPLGFSKWYDCVNEMFSYLTTSYNHIDTCTVIFIVR